MEKLCLNAINGVLVENKIYFASREMNMVYSLDLDSHIIDVLESPPEERTFQSGLYGNIVYICGKLVLVPFNAEKIWIYDLSEGSWHGIALGEIGKKPYKFLGAAVYDEYVYMLGYHYLGIIRLNIHTSTIEIIKLPYKECGDGLFFIDCIKKDEWLYTPVMLENKVLKLNLGTGEYKMISVGDSKNRYVGIGWDGEWFWLPPRRNGSYVLWDGADQVREYALPGEFTAGHDYFWGSSVMQEQVVFSGVTGMSLVFQKNVPEKPSIMKKNIMFVVKIDDDNFIFQDDKGKLFIKSKDQIKEFEYFGDSQIWDSLMKAGLSEKGKSRKIELIHESVMFSLEKWTAYLPYRENAADSANVGNSIYEQMKSV
jgi:hypothetical protein